MTPEQRKSAVWTEMATMRKDVADSLLATCPSSLRGVWAVVSWDWLSNLFTPRPGGNPSSTRDDCLGSRPARCLQKAKNRDGEADEQPKHFPDSAPPLVPRDGRNA